MRQTHKIISKIPNVKKMNLIELKTINWQQLDKDVLEIKSMSDGKLELVCINNLYGYVNRMTN